MHAISYKQNFLIKFSLSRLKYLRIRGGRKIERQRLSKTPKKHCLPYTKGLMHIRTLTDGGTHLSLAQVQSRQIPSLRRRRGPRFPPLNQKPSETDTKLKGNFFPMESHLVYAQHFRAGPILKSS